MSTPDSKAALKLLDEAAILARRVGAKGEAAALEAFSARFQNEKLTFKLLLGCVDSAMGKALTKICESAHDQEYNVLPEKEAIARDYDRILKAFLNVKFPPEWSELDIANVPSSKFVNVKSVSYKGDPSEVIHIVERTVEVIRRYTDLIGRGDFDAAYLLTATGLRDWMSKKRFVTEHEQAAKRYHGPALQYQIERFQFVYADAAARARSKADEGWPKTIPKDERRSCVTGFWIRDLSEQTGCWGGFLFTEEKNEYRIAKFTFFTQ